MKKLRNFVRSILRRPGATKAYTGARTGGETFRCSDGTVYRVAEAGNYVRFNPKPYRNKAERKALKRARVAARRAAA